MMDKAVLGTLDYILFVLMLLVSVGIGVFFRFSGGKQRTTQEYLLAGKDMSILPVSFSLMASTLSAISVMGLPTEMYRFGTHMAFISIGTTAAVVISSYILLPVFFEMGNVTVYEYLERRFGKIARTLASLSYLIKTILHTSVVLYAPALALSAVTNLSTWVSVTSIGLVCTCYCTLGGMKAVLWTDVFQAILMFLCMFTVLAKGFGILGGTENVFMIASDGGRLIVPGWETDPTVRYTMWNIFIQGFIMSLAQYGGDQMQVQRLLTVKSIHRARIALFISIPMVVCFRLLSCLCGIVMYAYFSRCDPMTAPSKPISKPDQMFPYFMMSILGSYQGLPGLCICGIFSAALSTVSSAINSMTAVTMQDLMPPCLSKNIFQKKAIFCAPLLTLFYGVLCLSSIFLVAALGDLYQASVTVYGILGGPVLGMIFAGMMTRRTNEKGIVVGMLFAIALSGWMSFGASANAPRSKGLAVSTEDCELLNSTFQSHLVPPFTNVTEMSFNFSASLDKRGLGSSPKTSDDSAFFLYRISFMWYMPIGFAVCLIVGYFASILFRLLWGERKEVSEELLSPVFKYFAQKFQKSADEKDINISGYRNSRS